MFKGNTSLETTPFGALFKLEMATRFGSVLHVILKLKETKFIDLLEKLVDTEMQQRCVTIVYM